MTDLPHNLPETFSPVSRLPKFLPKYSPKNSKIFVCAAFLILNKSAKNSDLPQIYQRKMACHRNHRFISSRVSMVSSVENLSQKFWARTSGHLLQETVKDDSFWLQVFIGAENAGNRNECSKSSTIHILKPIIRHDSVESTAGTGHYLSCQCIYDSYIRRRSSS